MKKKLLNISLFLIPVLFSILGFVYNDGFYFFVSLLSLITAISLLLPKKEITFSFKFPKQKFKKRIRDLVKKSTPAKKTSVAEKQAKPIQIKSTIFNKLTLLFFAANIVFFSTATILLLPTIDAPNNVLVRYYLSSLSLAREYVTLLSISILFLFILAAASIFKQKNTYHIKSLVKDSVVKIVVAIITVAIGFHLALGVAYLYAAAHVTFITAKYNKGLVSEKVISNPQEIKKHIQETKDMPKVVHYDYPYKKSLVLLHVDTNHTFYREALLTNLPLSLYETIQIANAPLFLLEDKLLITELKEPVLEELSPTLGKLLLKITFKNKNIQNDPKIGLLNRQEYLKLREEQINKDIEKIEKDIASIDQEIYVVQGYISEGQNQLQEAKNFLATAQSKKESLYNECKTAGETYEGEFYRYYTDDQCNSFKSEWESNIQQVSGQLGEMQSTLNHNQQVLADYQGIRSYAVEAKEFVDSTKDITPHELGIFLPEKDIKIALDSNNPDVFNSYLATLVHEYLHYTSYVSEERRIDHFFEEALTEYFARKVMKEQLDYTENVGYPVGVKLVTEMMKEIPEEKFMDVYFNKDQKQLEYLLNEAYGKNFYEDSARFFSTINYLPLDESLDAANTIMVRIDGEKISKESILKK